MEHRHCARRHWTILVVQSLPSFLCLCNIYDFCVSFWYSKVFLLYHCWLNMAKVSHNYRFWTIFGVAKHMAKNHTLGLPLAYNFGNEKSLLLWVFVWCIKLKHEPYWEIEDPKMEVVYHIKLEKFGDQMRIVILEDHSLFLSFRWIQARIFPPNVAGVAREQSWQSGTSNDLGLQITRIPFQKNDIIRHLQIT